MGSFRKKDMSNTPFSEGILRRLTNLHRVLVILTFLEITLFVIFVAIADLKWGDLWTNWTFRTSVVDVGLATILRFLFLCIYVTYTSGTKHATLAALFLMCCWVFIVVKAAMYCFDDEDSITAWPIFVSYIVFCFTDIFIVGVEYRTYSKAESSEDGYLGVRRHDYFSIQQDDPGSDPIIIRTTQQTLDGDEFFEDGFLTPPEHRSVYSEWEQPSFEQVVALADEQAVVEKESTAGAVVVREEEKEEKQVEKKKDKKKKKEPGAISELLNMLRGFIGVKDLDKVKLSIPAWIHDPLSGLERAISLKYPWMFSCIADQETDVDRLIMMVRWYMSDFHVASANMTPDGKKKAKKPYNPVLGETFVCHWGDAGQGLVEYFAEQVSHHPPIATFLYRNASKGIYYSGTTNLNLQFTGTAFRVHITGNQNVYLEKHDEEYTIKSPLYFVRGLLMNNIYMDFVGMSVIECPKTGLKAAIDFQEAGYFSGDTGRIEGRVFRTMPDGSEKLYAKLTGSWNGSVHCQKVDQPPEELMDVSKLTVENFKCADYDDLGELECRKLWNKLSVAIENEEWDVAAVAKTEVEEVQRKYRRYMAKGLCKPYTPRLFDKVSDMKYKFKQEYDVNTIPKIGWLTELREAEKKVGEEEE
eukprot:Lithocolla_globosa_v1_NODE_2453_length_1998_cov_21.430777.p1 type:complete len:641 gc:universal NODE_2453_length_1998_cov_21.430777:68-1990(+)